MFQPPTNTFRLTGLKMINSSQLSWHPQVLHNLSQNSRMTSKLINHSNIKFLIGGIAGTGITGSLMERGFSMRRVMAKIYTMRDSLM